MEAKPSPALVEEQKRDEAPVKVDDIKLSLVDQSAEEEKQQINSSVRPPLSRNN